MNKDLNNAGGGKAHTASPGALTFGSPNFKMLPEPLNGPKYKS